MVSTFSVGENKSQGHQMRECVGGMETNFYTEVLKLLWKVCNYYDFISL